MAGYHLSTKRIAVMLVVMLLTGLWTVQDNSVQAASPVKARKVAAGDNFTMVLKTDGSVVVWGSNSWNISNVPLLAQSGVVDIAAGANHALALLESGRVVAWGSNTDGQSNVPLAAQSDVIAIAAGEAHSMALQSNRRVIAWGSNQSNQINVPAEAQFGVSAIAAGREHSLALKNGGVIAWGRSDDGETSVPPDALYNIVALSSTNWYSSAALTADGRVVFWGLSESGTGQIPGEALNEVTSLAIGSSHVVAVKDGAVLAWGSSSSGKTDVPAAAQSGVRAVVAGSAHSVALKEDGTLVAWGNNLHNQSTIPGNANLSSLTISSGITTADFQSAVREYTHYVSPGTTSVNVSATLDAPAYGALLIDGEQQPGGAAVAVPLQATATAIAVQVEPFFLPGATYTVNVLQDAAAPTVSFGTNGNESWATSASTTVAVSDAESGVDDATLRYAWSTSSSPPDSHAAWLPFVNGDSLSLNDQDGDWYLHVQAQDRVGNMANAATARFRLDNTPPLIKVAMTQADHSAYIDDTWTNQHVRVNVSADDDSGIASLEFSLDSGMTWENLSPGTSLSLEKEGLHTLDFRAFDLVGWEAREQRSIKISKSGLKLTPTLSTANNLPYTSGTWTNDSVTLQVYAETGASGMHRLTASLNEGAASPYVSDTPIVLAQEGSHTVDFTLVDTAGNTLDASFLIRIDRSAPSISFAADGANNWSPIASTKVTVSDTLSGVDPDSLLYYWSTSPQAPDHTAAWTSFANGGTLSLRDTNGDWYLHIMARDLAGNTAYETSQRFQLDDSAAMLSGLSLSAGSLQPMFNAEITTYEAEVEGGVSDIQLTAVSGKPTDTITVSLNGRDFVPVASGQPSAPLGLQAGVNTVVVEVTARNGLQRAYRITLTRGSLEPPVESPTNSIILPPPNAYLVGPEGRTIRFEGGHIIIPQGALRTYLYLTLSEMDEIADTDWPSETQLASRAVRLVTDRPAELLKPVTVRLLVHGEMAEPDNLERYYYGLYARTEESSQWLELEHPAVNHDDNSIGVSGTLDHFGTAAVFARPVKQSEEESPAMPNTDFSDIAGHWAETDIRQAAEMGIIGGYPDGSFRPNQQVTRAEFIVMLMRSLYGEMVGEEHEAAPAFADSAHLPSWAKPALAQAVKDGIVSGYLDGTFKPSAEITRAEMAVMAATAIGIPHRNDTTSEFQDKHDFPQWAAPAIVSLEEGGLVLGDPNNRFRPYAPATRAESVILLLAIRAFQQLK